ncbi:MAG: hypothetical protein ACXVB6_13275, partial [Mucilaginibacter sp.]
MKITSLKGLTAEQERIYQGLLQIGELIASFYLDAILIIREECMLQTKVNLVAHCAREIDGALRGIFAPDKEKLSMAATLSGKDKGHIPVCGSVNRKPYKQTLVKYKGEWRFYINSTMLKDSPRRIGEMI